MKKLSFFFFLCILLSAFLGCDKNKITSISGRVLEDGTLKPLPNKMVYVHGATGEFLGSVSEYPIDTVYSDANGFYQWQTDDYTSPDAYVRAQDKYYNSKNTIVVNIGENKNKDLILQPKAWINFHIKNTKPFDDNDRLLINAFDSPFYGKNIDIIELKSNYVGNKKAYISWFVTKNSKTNNFQDSVFIKGVDTVDYYLNY